MSSSPALVSWWFLHVEISSAPRWLRPTFDRQQCVERSIVIRIILQKKLAYLLILCKIKYVQGTFWETTHLENRLEVQVIADVISLVSRIYVVPDVIRSKCVGIVFTTSE